MTVAARDRGVTVPPGAAGTPSILAAASGPLLIAAAVLVVLHGFWLHPKLTNQHVDHLSFWLPRWCVLGTNLAHGDLSTWLPNQFGGVPFLSDPQSGWLNLPAMFLFAGTSCSRALGLYVTIQPILAGLGLYLFFRQESLGRVAATVGGLTLALIMAGSKVALSIPFSATLAWTALALGAAAGFVHARTRARRLAWLAFTELCLVQVGAAHLTDGLLIAGLTVGLYLLARSVSQVRAGDRSGTQAAMQVLTPFLLLPALGAAVALPRISFLPRTSIGSGYQALDQLARQLSGVDQVPPFAQHGVGPWWGTAFARGPGGYAGVAGILLVPLAFTSSRFRLPAAGFAVLGVLGYVLNLDALVTSPSVRSFALSSRMGELWLRDPYRFRYLLPLTLAALAGYGLQAWLDRAPPGGRSLARLSLWLVPGAVVFVALPLVAGARSGSYVPLGLAAVASVPLLVVSAARAGVTWLVPVVTAIELVSVALAGQAGAVADAPPPPVTGAPDRGLGKAFPAFPSPDIDPAGYLAPGPIARAMRGSSGRYVTFDPATTNQNPRGFLLHQDPEDWPAYANGRSILYGLEEAQGYSPVQLERYWRLVRRVDRDAPIFYNAAFFQRLDPAVLRLLAVEWIIQPSALRPPPGASGPVAQEGRYALYRLDEPAPRASVMSSWRRVPPEEGLDRVLAPGFDGELTAIVEGGPAGRSGPAGPPGSAAYRQLGAGQARVRVHSSGPGILVVRNAFDPNWTATIDGHPAHVLPADYLLQGVAVPGGSHLVELIYRDDSVGVGLAVSGAAWALLLIALVWTRRAERRSIRAAEGQALWPVPQPRPRL